MQTSGLVRPGQAEGHILGRLAITQVMRWPLVMLAFNVLIVAMFWWLAYACWAADNTRAAWIFGSVAGLTTLPVALFGVAMTRASNRRELREASDRQPG